MILNGAHLQAVGHDQTRKAQFFPQKPLQNGRGHAGGQILLFQRREQDVCRHDGGHALCDGTAVGHQLAVHQLIQ